jgi:hypothetical protein
LLCVANSLAARGKSRHRTLPDHKIDREMQGSSSSAAPLVWYPKPDDDYVRHIEEKDTQIFLGDDSDLYDSTSFVITQKDSSLIFIQAILANLRPMYTHQPGIHIKYVDPSGRATVFSHKYETKHLLTEDSVISIGGFKFTRNPDKNSYHIEIDDKECKDIKGELFVESNEGGGVKFGDDGKTAFTEDRTAYSSMFYTIPRATVTGTLRVKGQEVTVDGYGFVSHFIQNMKPHRAAIRWSMMKFHSDEVTLDSDLLLTPRQYNKEKISHGIFVYKNKLTAVTVDNDIVYPTTEYDKATGYDAPTSCEYTWRGKTLDGQDFNAVIRLTPSNLIDKIDILGHLPWAIRMIIKAFVARPYHYQWLDRATATITIGDDTFTVDGQALHEVTFVNPE